MESNAARRAMLAALAAYIIFGFSFLFSTKALAVTTPTIMLAWRFFLAFLLMNLVLLTGKVKISLKGKNPLPLLLLGVFEPIAYFLCESYGLMHSNATFSAVMIALIPIFSIAYAALFMREVPTLGQVLFCLMSIAGVVLLSLQQTSSGQVKLLGILFLLGAICASVAFSAISRNFRNEFTAFERTYFMMMYGFVFFFAVALIENHATMPMLFKPLSSIPFIVSMLYLGGLSSVAAFLLINYSNNTLPLARTTSFCNVTSAVSVIAGVVFLGDRLNLIGWISVVLIIVGVYGVQKLARPLANEGK